MLTFQDKRTGKVIEDWANWKLPWERLPELFEVGRDAYAEFHGMSKFTQGDFAALIGRDRTEISDFEQGRRKPGTVELLCKAVWALGYTVEDVFGLSIVGQPVSFSTPEANAIAALVDRFPAALRKPFMILASAVDQKMVAYEQQLQRYETTSLDALEALESLIAQSGDSALMEAARAAGFLSGNRGAMKDGSVAVMGDHDRS